jgi:glycosyltransferase involved in cell wall biosynthesis
VRIVIVTTSWPSHEEDPTGHFVRAHARELERDGDSVRILAPRPGNAFGWPGVAARIEERPLRALDAAWWVVTARRQLAHMRADRIIAHWAVPCAIPIGAVSRAPLHVVSHGGDVRLLSALPPSARRALVASLAARAEQWAFVSNDLLEELLVAVDRTTRRCVERVAVVRAPPLDVPDVSAAVANRRRELGGRRVAVSVGRLVAGKRVGHAIAFVAQAAPPYLLVVVGDGPERASLERYAHDRGVEARFVGTVGRRDALAWIGAADVLVHASEAEGLSTVIREATALGTRVVRLTP